MEVVLVIFAVDFCTCIKGGASSEQLYKPPGRFLDGLAFLYYIGLFMLS